MNRRQWLIDVLSRWLRLRCPSVFHPPGQTQAYRCVGRPGHTGVLHGCGGAAWGDGADEGAHPAEPVLLRLSTLRDHLEKAAVVISARNHVIMVTASTAEQCQQLVVLLETMRDREPSADLDRAVVLARVWAESLRHLLTCTAADAHETGDPVGAVKRATDGTTSSDMSGEPTWRDYTIESGSVICPSDEGCDSSFSGDEDRDLELGEAVDWAQGHVMEHAQREVSGGERGGVAV